MVHSPSMDIGTIIIGSVGIAGFTVLALLIRKNQAQADPHIKAELDRRNQEIGELKNQIAKERSEKDELAGKGKQMYDSFKSMEADLKSLMKERDNFASRVAKYEAEEDRKQKKHEELIERQEEARKTLEDERMRIRAEDEERKQQALEERDRMWNDHEQTVVAHLNEITKKEHAQFPAFSNTNLPEGFSGSLKPDFMIEFLEQYVIFDAKVSRSQDLENYMKESVKKTAGKVKGNKKIYSTVFLVVPTDAVATLKKLHYYEEGFTFYIVSPEALEPILASLKRIEQYEFAEAMDPQERENIVDVIAAFHFHISARNAHELGIIKHGLDTLSKAEKMSPELLGEALVKKAKMRTLNLSTAETKELTAANPIEVEKELSELIQPKAKISTEDLGVNT